MKKTYPTSKKARSMVSWHKHIRANRNGNMVNKATRRVLKRLDAIERRLDANGIYE